MRGAGVVRREAGVGPVAESPPRKWGYGSPGSGSGPSVMVALWQRLSAGLSVLSRPLHTGTPARDVLLFEHERSRFFAILGLFCAGQSIFWASLALAALSPPPAPSRGRDAGASDRDWVNLRSALWRYGLAAGCSAMGTLVLGAGLVFSLRSVRSVMLRAGGQQVTLTTHAPFGLGACLTVPLNQVSCMAHRGEVPAMLPLKVKGRRFYFLLDKAGHFPNAQLFDSTVGAYRSL